MKLQPPKNSGDSVNVKGIKFHKGTDGLFDIPDGLVEPLLAHGYTQYTQAVAAEPEQASKEAEQTAEQKAEAELEATRPPEAARSQIQLNRQGGRR